MICTRISLKHWTWKRLWYSEGQRGEFAKGPDPREQGKKSETGVGKSRAASTRDRTSVRPQDHGQK